jgi:hypothetical protein
MIGIFKEKTKSAAKFLRPQRRDRRPRRQESTKETNMPNEKTLRHDEEQDKKIVIFRMRVFLGDSRHISFQLGPAGSPWESAPWPWILDSFNKAVS